VVGAGKAPDDNDERMGQQEMKRRSTRNGQRTVCFGVPMVILCLLLAGGCVSFSKPPYLVEQYTLEYKAPAPEKKAPVEEALMVERFSTAQAFNGTAMVYKPTSFKLATYVYHRWRVSPSDMVTDYLLRDLRNSGILRATFSYHDPAKARFSLEGGIEEFVQTMESDGSKAVLRLNVTLIDTNQTELTKRLLFQKEYSFVESLKDDSPAAYAEGMSRAMAKFSGQLTKDLYESLQERVKGKT
jgi:ABC-type uncharacterized transport system auxiliary subunit